MQELVSGCHVIIHKFPILPKYMNTLAVLKKTQSISDEGADLFIWLEIEDEKVGLIVNDILTCS